MGRSRYKIIDPQQPHFITLTVLHWIPVFTRPETVEILLDSIRFLGRDDLKVYAWVVLENHCHFVLQSNALDQDIARLKSWTAKKMIQYLTEHNVKTILDQLAFYKKAHKNDRAYQFWQEGVHPELIHSNEMMKQKIDYMDVVEELQRHFPKPDEIIKEKDKKTSQNYLVNIYVSRMSCKTTTNLPG